MPQITENINKSSTKINLKPPSKVVSMMAQTSCLVGWLLSWLVGVGQEYFGQQKPLSITATPTPKITIGAVVVIRKKVDQEEHF